MRHWEERKESRLFHELTGVNTVTRLSTHTTYDHYGNINFFLCISHSEASTLFLSAEAQCLIMPHHSLCAEEQGPGPLSGFSPASGHAVQAVAWPSWVGCPLGTSSLCGITFCYSLSGLTCQLLF